MKNLSIFFKSKFFKIIRDKIIHLQMDISSDTGRLLHVQYSNSSTKACTCISFE